MLVSTLSYTLQECSTKKLFSNPLAVSNRPNKPWILEHLMNQLKMNYAMQKRCKSSPLNSKLWNKYKAFKNSLNANLGTAKYNHFAKTFNVCSNSSQMWNFIKNDFVKSNTTKSKRLPTKIIWINISETITGDRNIANELNLYFPKVADTL